MEARAPVEPTPVPAAARLWGERYDMLDAWRGIAAVIVVCDHAFDLKFGRYAVMVFFVISGYCITAAAESATRKGMGFRTFMWRRVRRIYPPYALAVTFFVATRLAKLALTGTNQLARPWTDFVQNYTLTQWISLLFHPSSNAYDNPTLFVAAFWSLNYEEQFYLLMGVFVALVALTGKPLRTWALGLLPVALAWNAVFPSLSFGIFLEYWAHFGIGALVFYRLCRFADRRVRVAIDAALAVMCVVTLALAVRSGAMFVLDRSVPLELASVSGFALVLIGLRRVDRAYDASFLAKILTPVGLVSYSLYLIHQFNINVARGVAAALTPAATPQIVVNVVVLLAHLALAAVFWRLCERPFLNRRLDAAPAPAARAT